MSEWVSESEVSFRLGYKIILAGLSEAGKTAVKRIFFLKQQTQDVDNLSATLNYERLILNVAQVPITIVDLGGQRVFLKRFLGSFSPFIFNGVKAFIFLIDVANKTTRNNSIQYFANCIEKLEEFSPDAHYYVFFHKNDLVRHLPNYESIHAQLKEQFQLDSPKKISFFRTTIYRPETVIDGFGRIFELTMPRLAQSDYVDGRQIGEIEEYAEKYLTLAPTAVQTRKKEILPQVSPPITPSFSSPAESAAPQDSTAILDSLQRLMPSSGQAETPPAVKGKSSAKMAGDPTVLARLQSLMREGLEKEAATPHPIAESVPYLSSMAVEETTSETVLAHKEVTFAAEADPSADSSKLEESITINERMNHLIHFYGIDVDDATALAKSAYADVFEAAATLRIPIPLVLDVILKYLPFIRSKGLKVENLTTKRILDVFGAHLRGRVKEGDLLQCLVIAAERPKWDMEKIIQKFFAKPDEKIKEKERKRKEEKPTVAKPHVQVQISIPVETESQEGILALPDSQGMGFAVELTTDSNCRLLLYQQGYLVSEALVSSKITIDELMYLLFYELNLPFEGEAGSISFAARIIHSAIGQTVKTSEIEAPKPVAPLETEKVQFILPVEVVTEEGFMRLPDSQDITFKVMAAEQGFQVVFRQRGHDIGQTTISKPMSARQLVSLMKDVMLLPIESEDALDFAARIIIAAFRALRQKGISTSAAIETHDPEEDDETSKELKRYLEALQGSND